MEYIVLITVIFFLIVLLVIKEALHYKERDKLTNKLMATDFLEYSNYDLACRETTSQVKESSKRLI